MSWERRDYYPFVTRIRRFVMNVQFLNGASFAGPQFGIDERIRLHQRNVPDMQLLVLGKVDNFRFGFEAEISISKIIIPVLTIN